MSENTRSIPMSDNGSKIELKDSSVQQLFLQNASLQTVSLNILGTSRVTNVDLI